MRKNMKKTIIKILMIVATPIMLLSSCVKDLDVTPIDPNIAVASNVFKDSTSYKMALAKVYACFAANGQSTGGKPDITGIDENFGNYVRLYWNLQELPTDEAIMAWDDATIKDFHWHTWAPNDVFVSAMYSRIFYAIVIANEFIRTATDAIGSASGNFKKNLEYYRAEARFLRALSYFHAIDMFGNVPFVTEEDKPGAYYPQQIQRDKLFLYLEKELKEIENELAEPKTNEYGRADKAAAWMLLAKLYMNAKVYTGTERYADALLYTKKVINSPYTLDLDYRRIFCANNNESPEIIFPICFDGQNTANYGGTTFLLHASNGGGMPLYGIDGGWGGIRTIKDFMQYFGIDSTAFSESNPQPEFADKRAMFYFNPKNWKWTVANVGTFTEGIGVIKYKNVTSTGEPAPNAHPTFVSTDFPVFRLADAYLMYAEAVLRGASGGDRATALNYVNALRERAFGDNSQNISDAQLTLEFILAERARELYWEGHRRTDLIRFGKFTGGDYIWSWKGKVPEGKATESYRNLYPLPSSDINANPNLTQNEGYE